MTGLGRLAVLGIAALALGCFSGGSGGGGASATGGTGAGAPSGTGATGSSGSGGNGTAGTSNVGRTGGAGGVGAGAGGNACCPCPDQPQPAGCLECDLFCPDGEAGSGGSTASCDAIHACPRGEDCCPGPGGNYCVATGTCVPAKCASPDTPIATPSGERPIVELREGDLVLSIDHGAVVAVPIVATGRRAVTGHAVARIELDGGRLLEMSAGHPTADGRTLGVVAPGDLLGDAHVASVSMIPYTHAFTYDILPASDTGAYFAAGARVGSTLAVHGSGGAR